MFWRNFKKKERKGKKDRGSIDSIHNAFKEIIYTVWLTFFLSCNTISTKWYNVQCSLSLTLMYVLIRFGDNSVDCEFVSQHEVNGRGFVDIFLKWGQSFRALSPQHPEAHCALPLWIFATKWIKVYFWAASIVLTKPACYLSSKRTFHMPWKWIPPRTVLASREIAD